MYLVAYGAPGRSCPISVGAGSVGIWPYALICSKLEIGCVSMLRGNFYYLKKRQLLNSQDLCFSVMWLSY